MLMFINILYSFYTFKNKEVFLKEQSRGLYSYYTYWCLSSIPVYILQILSTLLYGIIIYYWLELNPHEDRPLFYLLIITTMSLIGNIILETVVYIAPSIRQCYYMFPATIFILYYFSNVPIKPSTYATWMAKWVPNLSIFRWTIEACILNEFHDYSSTAFQSSDVYLYYDLQPPGGFDYSQVPVSSPYLKLLYSFDSYQFFLWVLGFDSLGDNRGYCYGIVFLNLIIFRLISMAFLRYTSVDVMHKRHFYKSTDENY
jgi:hypothetical protein